MCRIYHPLYYQGVLTGVKWTKASAAPYAMSEMNGTTAIEATIATANIIITSLYRHGNFFVQCFVLSKIDILILRILSIQSAETPDHN